MLAIIHPGFAIPPFVQGLAVVVPSAAAALIEALHFVKTHNLEANLLAADHVVNQLVANSNKPTDTSVA